MTAFQIIKEDRTGRSCGRIFTIDGSIEENLDQLIGRLLDEKPENLIEDIKTKGIKND